MKLRTNKKWWQFWIPEYVDILDALVRDAQTASAVDSINNSSVISGRVVKANARPEYDPTPRKKGGRVTKAMPRQLRKIKEGQEKAGIPTINGLPLDTPEGRSEERRV
jgi:hypothetical protein